MVLILKLVKTKILLILTIHSPFIDLIGHKFGQIPMEPHGCFQALRGRQTWRTKLWEPRVNLRCGVTK